jgi:ribonuclease BN (tRNA processing enzyme)
MEVVFLGTGGTRAAGRAASCNLILIHGKARLLVDAGSGAFTRLGELGIGLHDLDTILLTHLHIDHTAELYTRHSPPKRIGEVAKASGARHLILTHIPPLVDKARSKVSTSIQAADPEAVQFAEDKMRVFVE